MPTRRKDSAKIAVFHKKYEQQFDIFSELTLRLPNTFQGYVPDLTIYEAGIILQTEEEV